MPANEIVSREEKGLGQATQRASGELAASAAASMSKATIEAAYTIALHRPRNIDDARAAILKACRRPRFAEAARYSKPVAGKAIIGPSIRYAEQAIQAFGNVRVACHVTHEDDSQRVVNVSVTDLETNITYGQDVCLQKTVERKDIKYGMIQLSERTNSNGQKVYLVRATEDDLANKTAAAQSKIIRNMGLRLIPKDIIEESMEVVEATLAKGDAQDPDAKRKALVDAFALLGVKASDLEGYLGHPLSQVAPKELSDLRAMYAAIQDGEATWSDYGTKRAGQERGTIDVAGIKAGKLETHTEPGEPAKSHLKAQRSEEDLKCRSRT